MRLRHLLTTAALTVAATTVLGIAPAGAQQLVDAGKEGDGSGGLAFVIFALVCFTIAGLSSIFIPARAVFSLAMS